MSSGRTPTDFTGDDQNTTILTKRDLSFTQLCMFLVIAKILCEKKEHNMSQEEVASNLNVDQMESLRTLPEPLTTTYPAECSPSSPQILLDNCDDILSEQASYKKKRGPDAVFYCSFGSEFHRGRTSCLELVHRPQRRRARPLLPPTPSGCINMVTTLRAQQPNAFSANHAKNSAHRFADETVAIASNSTPSSPQGFHLERRGLLAVTSHNPHRGRW